MQRRDFMRMVLASAAMFSGERHAAAAKPLRHPLPAELPILHDQIQWAPFLSRHDLVWERLPSKWTEGAFIGNGLLGGMVYTEKGAVRWDIGRSDVCDHRTPPEGRQANLGSYYRARFYIGHFLLKPVGKITDGAMRLTLWDAEATGTIHTDRGSITWRAFVPTEENAMTIELTTTGQEHAFTWNWVPDVSSSPRQLFGRPGTPMGYVPNPPPTLSQVGDTHVCTQTMLAGGEYDTAWSDTQTASGTRRITIGVGYSTQDARARQEALQAVRQSVAQTVEHLAVSHRAWWHAFYPQSFLSIPDTRLESLYWI